MDDELNDDEISQWAESLTPEGSPGLMTERMRQFLGDAGYEKAMAQQDATANLYIQRQTLINMLLTLVTGYGFLFGVLGVVASVTLLLKLIF